MSQTTDQSTDQRAVVTRTVGTGEATVHYDVRGDLAGATPDCPAVVLFGSPMDAGGFATLASHLTDRPVVTFDPRGAGRNPAADGPITAVEHAADLEAVIRAVQAAQVEAGGAPHPVDVFGTSGGAVNLLAFLARPGADGLVRRVVAHESPTAALLPDREVALAACAAVVATYERAGTGPAMAAFIALVVHDGELDDEFLARPAPDPSHLGMSAVDDGTRTHPLMRNMAGGLIAFEPDLAALARLGDRLVIASGAASNDGLAVRGGRSVAAALGVDDVVLPGDHTGFLGGEHGRTGEPEAFADRLREVLAG